MSLCGEGANGSSFNPEIYHSLCFQTPSVVSMFQLIEAVYNQRGLICFVMNWKLISYRGSDRHCVTLMERYCPLRQCSRFHCTHCVYSCSVHVIGP